MATYLSQTEAESLRNEIAAVTRQRDAALAVLVKYERWEGALIADREAWRSGPLPVVTAPHWETMMELQTERNAVVRAARASGVLPAAKQVQ